MLYAWRGFPFTEKQLCQLAFEKAARKSPASLLIPAAGFSHPFLLYHDSALLVNMCVN